MIAVSHCPQQSGVPQLLWIIEELYCEFLILEIVEGLLLFILNKFKSEKNLNLWNFFNVFFIKIFDIVSMFSKPVTNIKCRRH